MTWEDDVERITGWANKPPPTPLKVKPTVAVGPTRQQLETLIDDYTDAIGHAEGPEYYKPMADALGTLYGDIKALRAIAVAATMQIPPSVDEFRGWVDTVIRTKGYEE